MNRIPSLVAITLVASVFVGHGVEAAGEAPLPSWDKWQPLIGNWKAEGSGSPGAGVGTFSFAFDLQKRILARKSHTDYPVAEGRPAFAHDDLLIVYADESAHRFRADYYDNEGHVIRYTAEFAPDGKTLTLLSDAAPSQPVFRLTYTWTGKDTLGIKFEIAPPNAPEQFKVYVEGTAHRA